MGKETKSKEPIRIRTKKLANGNISLYLDIYINGKREYEFLKLYLIPEYNKVDKDVNTATLRLANAVKAQKIVEIQNNVHGFSNSGLKSKMKLVDYIRYIADKDDEKRGRKTSLNTLLHHLQRYDPNDSTFSQLNKEYIQGFVSYLKSAKQMHSKEEKLLSSNSQAYYYKMLNYCLSYAVSDDILLANPMNKIKQEDKPKRTKSVYNN